MRNQTFKCILVFLFVLAIVIWVGYASVEKNEVMLTMALAAGEPTRQPHQFEMDSCSNRYTL